MSAILYYSNYCKNSTSLIQSISKSKLKEELHYCCIDNRIRKPDGVTYILLENRQEIILPHTITKVPALLLLNKSHQVILGQNDILSYLKPQEDYINQIATNNNGEPNAFSFYSGVGSSLGVVSDNYSFLDQTAESLTAKGDGGLRQLYHYATLELIDNIDTPTDTYTPDKISPSISIENLQKNREESYQIKK
jgi:hypothetical protein